MLLYFEPMFKGPESGFHFDSEKKRFRTTPLVDPTTGVVTEWEKKIGEVGTRLVRIDRFPSGPLRMVTYSEYSFGEGSTFSKREHAVSYVANDIEREIRLCQESDSTDLRLIMFLNRQGAFLFFDAQYTAEGVLKDFSLSFRPKSSSEMLSDLPLFEKINHFEGRSLEENLKELRQIFFMRGEAAFWVGADLDEKDAQADNYKLDSLREEIGKWPADMIEKMSKNVSAVIGITIMKYLRDSLSDEQIATMLSALTPQVVEMLLIDSGKPRDTGEMPVTQSLHILVASLLGWYYEKLEEVGGMEVRFATSEEDPQRFSLSVRESLRDRSLAEALVVLGEAYPFEEYSYVVEKEGDQQIQLARRSVLTPNLQDRITFPAFLDPRVINFLTTEENVGWERAIELAEITYVRSDN